MLFTTAPCSSRSRHFLPSSLSPPRRLLPHLPPKQTLPDRHSSSICLGLFALLCWDAIFAPVVATRAASPLPPAYPQRNSFRATGGNLTGSPVSGDRHPHARSDREDSPSVGMSSGNRLADGSVVEPGDCSERVAERSGHHSLGVGIGEDCPSGRSTAEEADQGRNARNDEEDVFYYHPFPSPYQSEPLDLMTTAFAWRRRHLLRGIYDRVEQQGGAESLLRCNWGKHYGKACTGAPLVGDMHWIWSVGWFSVRHGNPFWNEQLKSVATFDVAVTRR